MTTLQLKERKIEDLKVKYHNLEARHRNERELWEEQNANRHKEISRLTDLIVMLQQHIAKIEAECESLIAEKSEITKTNKQLKEMIDKQVDLITTLQGRLSQNSSNSSRPSSTNGFKSVIHNSRVASGKKPGGQIGHEGHGLSMTEQLKEELASGGVNVEVVEHGNPELDYITKYELDVCLTVVVKEHRFHEGEAIPDNLQNPVNYGIDLKALSVYLSTEGLMSAQRVSEFVKIMTGGMLMPSKATILAFQCEVSGKLADEMEAIRESVMISPVLNVDETPIKCTERPAQNGDFMDTAKGTTYNLCVRTYSTKDTVHLTLNPRKDDAGVKADGILPTYAGKKVHDHDKKFFKYGSREQGECNAHVGRYLKEIDELTKHEWPMKMGKLLLDILRHKKMDIANNRNAMEDESFKRYSDEYDAILNLGKKEIDRLNPKSIIRRKAQNLLSRLEQYKYNHLLFANDYSVPYSNNEAERDFRWIKVHQKVSGCHRSFQGAGKMIRLMSFTRTLKKRRLPIFESLKHILRQIPVLT